MLATEVKYDIKDISLAEQGENQQNRRAFRILFFKICSARAGSRNLVAKNQKNQGESLTKIYRQNTTKRQKL